MVTLPDNITIAVAISLTAAVAGSDGYAARTDTHTNLFRASRYCDANSDRCDRDHCKTLDHYMLLKSVNYQGGNPGRLEWFHRDDRSAMISHTHRKPDRDGDERHDDRAPYHRRSPFRTPASRGFVGGVIELPVHLAPLLACLDSVVG